LPGAAGEFFGNAGVDLLGFGGLGLGLQLELFDACELAGGFELGALGSILANYLNTFFVSCDN
jgi:hypothetical protein